MTERWNVQGTGQRLHGRSLFFLHLRHDLYGFGDILAMKVGEPHQIVQTTSDSNVSARVKKILAEPRALLWLKSGGSIVVHGWKKVLKKEGGVAMVWRVRTVSVTQEMFNG